jgi:hypothetical protein
MNARTDNPNLAILEIAAQALGDLTHSLVFIGGCATGLLITRIRAYQIRPTEDVDVVAEVATITEYHSIEAQLASRGFKHDISPDAPICRWIGAEVTLDVMPSQPGVLSFHNRWYPLAVSTAIPVSLPSGRSIKLITAPLLRRTQLRCSSSVPSGLDVRPPTDNHRSGLPRLPRGIVDLPNSPTAFTIALSTARSSAPATVSLFLFK